MAMVDEEASDAEGEIKQVAGQSTLEIDLHTLGFTTHKPEEKPEVTEIKTEAPPPKPKLASQTTRKPLPGKLPISKTITKKSLAKYMYDWAIKHPISAK